MMVMVIKEKIKKQPQVLVIGDFILDQYYWTDVSRISPEAPVPICHIKKTTHCLGGAGNVANNLSVFGANVSIAGILGNDESSSIMRRYFKAAEINTELMLTSEQYPTICKSRIIAKGQQLCRLDQEDTGINIEDKILDLLNELKSSSLKFDCIVLSDYKKGMLTNVLTNAHP